MANTYGRRKPQIKKQDLYMMTALWMEQSPWRMKPTKEPTKEPTDQQRVVGAVFVRPNDRVLSVDCSRSNDGGSVHGAIRALIKYPDMIEGCQVYLSRQPCAHCVKMLVQARVTKVFYLPLKPEKDEEENKSVDALFKVSPVSREIYVPHITEDEFKELDKYVKDGKNIYLLHELERDEVAIILEWADDWKDQISKALCWEEYNDSGIKTQVDEDMQEFLKWFSKGVLETGTSMVIEWQDSEQASTGHEKPALDVANHLSRLAQMLSYRTDDPNTGVGCVITLDDEIVSIGWNGFPSKALYGNHPRGSRKDDAPSKYRHIIYALENALLCRNQREIKGSIVYHTIEPPDENTSMLKQLGAKTLIMPSGSSTESSEERGKLKVVTL